MTVRFSATGTALAAAAVLVLTGPALAAGGHGSSGGHGHAGDHGHAEGGHGGSPGQGHQFPFGRAATASEADRTIEMTAEDAMSYSPSGVKVQAGETVRFQVENAGSLPHSFTLATPKGQRRHEQSMQGMPAGQIAGHMAGEPNGMVLQPGETKSLTWHFTESGTVQFACHIPGHFEAGMKGRIRVR